MEKQSHTECENSIEGIAENLSILGAMTRRGVKIVAETLQKLPCEVRENTITEASFLLMDCVEGTVIGITFPPVKKEDLKLAGGYYFSQRERPIIVLNLNQRSSKSTKMSTVAHEIAHFILGHWQISRAGRVKDPEREADDLIEK